MARINLAILPAILVFTILILAASIPTHYTLAQESQRTLTNADILNMTKSGLADQTIILMIQKSATKFDTSPEAVIELKKAGVSDAVLNAVLAANPTDVISSSAAPTSQQHCSESLDKALAAIGAAEKINNVHAIRIQGQSVVTRTSGSISVQVERVTVYPASIYMSVKTTTGLAAKTVLTPEFNYLVSGKMTTTIPVETMQELLLGLKLDPIYVSQHRDQYGCVLEGIEQVGNVTTSRLGLKGEGIEGYWNIDPGSGRIFRATIKVGTDQQVTDYSDWRQVDGIYCAFKRHFVKAGLTSDATINEFQVNPTIDANLFQPPANQISGSLTFKVLQEESVPYVVQTNGGISTACNISGSTSTSMTASTYGNTTYGTATSTPNLQMNCKSTDTTIRWTHVLNAMLVEASDGNAYIIACDRAWRWSKCTPLRAGDTFLAERTDKGFRVHSINSKSKEQEAIYSVLKSKSLHE